MAKKSKSTEIIKTASAHPDVTLKNYALKQAGDIEGLRKLPKDSIRTASTVEMKSMVVQGGDA